MNTPGPAKPDKPDPLFSFILNSNLARVPIRELIQWKFLESYLIQVLILKR